MVTDGKITRNAKVRVIRDGKVVYTSAISSLKRFQNDAKEVAAGYECGITIDNFNDLKENDLIEAYDDKIVVEE
jgi:translation initiation factor IF-2